MLVLFYSRDLIHNHYLSGRKDMLNSLRIQNERVAIEAFAGANVQSLLSNTFPALLSDIKGFFGSFTSDTPAIALSPKERDFVKELAKHAYGNLSPLAAFVPEGLDTTYLKYSNILLNAAEHVSHLTIAVLPSYANFLSSLINNQDAKLSTISFNKIYQELTVKREVLNQELGLCFKRGSTKTEVTFGDVVARNNDWEKVFVVNAEMLKHVNSVDRKVLNKKIQECSELLEVIMLKMKRNEFENMSPEVIINLSNGAYQVARELEFFSVTYFKVVAYTNAVNRTIDHFKNVFSI